MPLPQRWTAGTTDVALLTPAETARELSISEKQLRMLTSEGLLPYVNIGCGAKRETRRYAPEDVAEFIAERRKRDCQSTNVRVPTPTPTTFAGVAIDFQARRAKKLNEKQSRTRRN